ncbi:MAG: hypothetical protein ACYTXC_19405 [Nostoc sp.]
MPNAPCPNLSNESLQDIAAAMAGLGYAYANKIAKLTKEIKIQASCNQQWYLLLLPSRIFKPIGHAYLLQR